MVSLSTLQSFPGQGSIPPASFYTIQGLANWLNNNPTYKLNFSYTGEFKLLIPPEMVTSSLSTMGYNIYKVPLSSNVTTLSDHQSHKYRSQLQLFNKVYTTNSNAYISSIINNQLPTYYTFSSYTEKYEYNSAVQLVNKLYSFKAMADAPGVNWIIPFPL